MRGMRDSLPHAPGRRAVAGHADRRRDLMALAGPASHLAVDRVAIDFRTTDHEGIHFAGKPGDRASASTTRWCLRLGTERSTDMQLKVDEIGAAVLA